MDTQIRREGMSMDREGEREERKKEGLTGSRKYPEHVLLINSGGLLTAASFANEFALVLAFTIVAVLAVPTEEVVVKGVKGVMGCNPPMPPRAGERSAASFGCAFSCAARSIGDMKYEAEPEPELEPERRSVRAAFASVGLAMALGLAEPFASFVSAPLNSASFVFRSL